MRSPLVSIVLPTYNGSRYVGESITSCLEQTYGDFELIIVDDCSTDSTPDILQAYAQRDSRIRVIRHPDNRKLPAALNTGFAAAQGDYFTWISDDNKYRPDAITEMARYLECHGEVFLVYSDLTVMDETGKEFKRVRVESPRVLIRRNVVLASFLYRRSVCDVLGGYDSDMFLAEDYDYWLRVNSRYKIAPLHKDLYLYRDHGGSLTMARDTRRIEAHLRVLKKNVEYYSEPKQKAHLCTQIALISKQCGLQEQAREYAQRARSLHMPVYIRHGLLGPLGWPMKQSVVKWIGVCRARWGQ